MSELLLLDYAHQPDVSLVGIDLDHEALDGAFALAREHGLEDRLSLRLDDAWEMRFDNEFDVLTSNGLNIYESDEARVDALYRSFFRH
jgi:cyclopropane fatty-acyl-phospholipid synthase-like methyltransferase